MTIIEIKNMKLKWKEYRESIDPLNEHGKCGDVNKYCLSGHRLISEMGSLDTITERDGKYCLGFKDKFKFDTLEEAKRKQLEWFQLELLDLIEEVGYVMRDIIKTKESTFITKKNSV